MMTAIFVAAIWICAFLLFCWWLEVVESTPVEAEPLTEMAFWVASEEALNLANADRIDAEAREFIA